jgi:hypothetical protein
LIALPMRNSLTSFSGMQGPGIKHSWHRMFPI